MQHNVASVQHKTGGEVKFLEPWGARTAQGSWREILFVAVNF